MHGTGNELRKAATFMVPSISPRPIMDHTMYDEDSPQLFSDEEEIKG
jgi:hypothetical protein